MNQDFCGDDPAELAAMLQMLFPGGRISWRHGARTGFAVAGAQHDGIAVYEVLHAAPFECAIAGAPAHCIVLGTQGEGMFRGGNAGFRCAPGGGGIVPADGECTIAAERMLGYFLLRVDPHVLAAHCAGWLGEGAERPLAFERARLSEELCLHLGQAVAALHRAARMQWSPAPATTALTEHALNLLLALHPHDRSARLRQRLPLGKSRVREARWWIDHADEPLTAGELAARMRVPVVPLAMAFRQHQPETPLDALLRAASRRDQAGDSPRSDECPLADVAARDGCGTASGEGGHSCLTARQIASLDEFIEQRLGDKLSLAALADGAGVGRRSFPHRFRNTFGITPMQYLIRQRLEEAKRLLEQTAYSISDIAVRTGFFSHSHLSSQFLRRAGVTPSDYRRGLRAAAEDRNLPRPPPPARGGSRRPITASCADAGRTSPRYRRRS